MEKVVCWICIPDCRNMHHNIYADRNKVQKLKAKDYMIYLLMAGSYGMTVPFIFLLTRVVTNTIPSLLCVMFSFLLLVALIIFKKEEVLQEIHKKFHI